MTDTPPKVETIVAFNYAKLQLSEDKIKILKKAAGRIKSQMYDSVVEIGRNLNKAKKILGHGRLGPWLRAEFGMSERTAQRCMAAARLAAKSDSVSELPPSALHALSAPSTSESARKKVIALLEAGERPGTRVVGAMIRESKEARGDKRNIAVAKQVSSPSKKTEKRHQPVILCTPEVEQAIRQRHPPTDKKSYWARIQNDDDRLIINRLKAARRRRAKD